MAYLIKYVPPSYLFQESLYKIVNIFFFHVLQNSLLKPSGPGEFFFFASEYDINIFNYQVIKIMFSLVSFGSVCL